MRDQKKHPHPNEMRRVLIERGWQPGPPGSWSGFERLIPPDGGEPMYLDEAWGDRNKHRKKARSGS
jgi:hypothetical protein